MQHILTFDVTRRNKIKPTNDEVGNISYNLKTPKEVSIESFSKVISYPYGLTFSPSIFKDNKRSNNNWLNQSVFCLDFDSGITPDEVLLTLEELSLDPQVVYTSFSDSPVKRKFRVVFFLDSVIYNKDKANYIQLGLMSIFGSKVDNQTSDRARLYYGGKDIIYLNKDELSLEQLELVLNDISPRLESKVSIEKCFTINTVKLEVEKKLKFVQNILNKKGLSFNEGNKHTFAVQYASICNGMGIDINDSISYAAMNGIYSEHFILTLKDIYRRYSRQYGNFYFKK